MWWKKRTRRKELEEDAREDLELKDEDADKVAGGEIAAGVHFKYDIKAQKEA